jgi:hypothetical protein
MQGVSQKMLNLLIINFIIILYNIICKDKVKEKGIKKKEKLKKESKEINHIKNIADLEVEVEVIINKKINIIKIKIIKNMIKLKSK